MAISTLLRKRIKRANSITVVQGLEQDPESPDFRTLLWARQQNDLQIVRDVHGGTGTMRDAAKVYMPNREAETDRQYQARLAMAVLFNAVKRTNDALAGMLFRKDPVFDGPDRIAEHLANVDQGGTGIAVWAKRQSADALRDGHIAIHVDFPDTSGIATRLDERRAQVRPYWIPITKDQLINVRLELRQGAPFITRAVYTEDGVETDGTFGESAVERRRELFPGGFRTWIKNDRGKWLPEREGRTSLTYVPLVPLYATQPAAFFETAPPFLDLAYENIAHWQTRNARRWTLEVAGVPLAVFVGRNTEDLLEWGPFRALDLEGDNAHASYLEVEGKSLAEMRQEVLDIEARMAALGLSMLVRETRAAETAEAKRMDRAEGDSVLATAAAGIELGLNAALRVHGDYIGAPEPGTITVNRDFMATPMTPQMVLALSQQVAQGYLRLEDLLAALKAGELLPQSYDVEAAVAELETGDIMDDAA